MSCKGLRYDKNTEEHIECNKKKNLDDDGYCPAHMHQKEYTETQLEKMLVCFTCQILFYSDVRKECDKCYNRRHNKVKCNGKSVPRGKGQLQVSDCRRKPAPGMDYCIIHSYMNNYTEDMMNNLTKCRRCSTLHYIVGDDIRCDRCKNESNYGKARCSGKMVLRNTKEIADCADIVKEEGDYCKNHEHQKEYSKEERDNMVVCSGCIKAYYLPKGKQCDNCKIRGKKNSALEIDNSLVPLAKEGQLVCSNKKCKQPFYSKHIYLRNSLRCDKCYNAYRKHRKKSFIS